MKTAEERFFAKVEKTDECWLWTAGTVGGGYGRFSVSGSKRERVRVVAHRYAYELLVGPIPEGLDLDHLCRVRHCVNPSHLEPVTRKENVLRGESANARKTHCKHGHEFTETNTYIYPNGKRHCRTCRASSQRKRRALV